MVTLIGLIQQSSYPFWNPDLFYDFHRYLENILKVDRGIQRVVQLMDDFYGHDGKTSYFFTADHGMSNTGSHGTQFHSLILISCRFFSGDGNPDNTRTPIIAWGAGIRGPNPEPMKGHDDFSYGWTNLSPFERKDVLQADIAPLMVY